MASTRSHAQESQEGGTAAEHAIGHGGAATEHAATTNTDLPRGIATERAFGCENATEHSCLLIGVGASVQTPMTESER